MVPLDEQFSQYRLLKTDGERSWYKVKCFLPKTEYLVGSQLPIFIAVTQGKGIFKGNLQRVYRPFAITRKHSVSLSMPWN